MILNFDDRNEPDTEFSGWDMAGVPISRIAPLATDVVKQDEEGEKRDCLGMECGFRRTSFFWMNEMKLG
jgi:hypothetical protein